MYILIFMLRYACQSEDVNEASSEIVNVVGEIFPVGQGLTNEIDQ